jgi:hypothetical protein
VRRQVKNPTRRTDNSVRLGRMSKESTRKRTGQARTIPISDEVHQAILEQCRLFAEKFGREPGPSDPIFFDPDADTPQPISEEKLRSGMLAALAAAGADPITVYAFNKTGLLVSEDNVHLLSAEDLAEWEQAVEEARRMFQTNKA